MFPVVPVSAPLRLMAAAACSQASRMLEFSNTVVIRPQWSPVDFEKARQRALAPRVAATAAWGRP